MHEQHDHTVRGNATDRTDTIGSDVRSDTMTPSLENLERQLRESLRRRVSTQQFKTWFSPVGVHAWQPGQVTLKVPNLFYLEWLTKNFLPVIGEAASEVAAGPTRVELLVVRAPSRDGAAETPPPRLDPPPTGPRGLTGEPQPSQAAGPHTTDPGPSTPASPPAQDGRYQPTPFAGSGALDIPLQLNDGYTFDQYVTGPSNTVAYASARAVAQKPGRAYNPLFIHGSVGLGKTHLLQAICRTFMDTYPQDRICYLSCEEFTNEFIQALKRKDVQRFRDRFRNVHLLVIDDIHFLKGKEQTQEEFFHTFNNLYQSNRQIVISSDAPPSQIPSLEDRLISRFQWGLVTKLEQPDMETRMAILQRKAEGMGIHVPMEVVEYIATHFRNNIRELEGALLSLQAHAGATGGPITSELARAALESAIHEAPATITVDEVVSLVCEQLHVTISDLQGPRRTRAISEPRQIAMYLVRQITRRSLEEIGNFFGGRDHSTVLYAIRRMEDRVQQDVEFKARMDRLIDRFGPR